MILACTTISVDLPQVDLMNFRVEYRKSTISDKRSYMYISEI